MSAALPGPCPCQRHGIRTLRPEIHPRSCAPPGCPKTLPANAGRVACGGSMGSPQLSHVRLDETKRSLHENPTSPKTSLKTSRNCRPRSFPRFQLSASHGFRCPEKPEKRLFHPHGVPLAPHHGGRVWPSSGIIFRNAGNPQVRGGPHRGIPCEDRKTGFDETAGHGGALDEARKSRGGGQGAAAGGLAVARAGRKNLRHERQRMTRECGAGGPAQAASAVPLDIRAHAEKMGTP